ncbi:hypothetical protein PF66_06228 [Pseudomonas asplenii]|uniref:Uncharacterized protein n=1 Tax=Pseudomonas asplenii TaxID=53407 RepID=A0A0M9GC59_9PSED|nr:hypothetical protein [Pseudomonas fuscovaginae]KPA87318.1 hypothetical protein PF66_06228 [Pseudomonas fuscovaginae]
MHIITQNDRMERMSDYLRGEAVRSLDLLRQIDGTIEALVLMRRQMDAFHEAIQSLNATVLSAKNCFFKEEEIIPSLEQAQEILAKIHSDLEQRLVAARKAPELRSEDGVDDAYAQAINSILSYNAAIEQLRWNILEHNADMEGRQESKLLTTDEDIDDLFSNL